MGTKGGKEAQNQPTISDKEAGRQKLKAKLIYNEIDRNSLFFGLVNKEDRSNMNATFNLNNDYNQNKFEQMCLDGWSYQKNIFN